MPYRRSEPERNWRTARARTIGVLAEGHASVGGVSGRGRPLDVSKPLAHGYIIVMLREFQGFVRDLHDLTAQRLVASTGAAVAYWPMLVEGLTRDRAVDRGNATQDAIKKDFRRLGIAALDISAKNGRWTRPGGTDSRTFDAMVELRNALGHGNEAQLRKLLAAERARDSVSWARGNLPVLNRYARALDKIVWDHLVRTTGSEPWT